MVFTSTAFKESGKHQRPTTLSNFYKLIIYGLRYTNSLV